MNETQVLELAGNCLLWLDEQGHARVLRKDKRSGRTVVGRRVRRDLITSLLDSGKLYRGTNSDTCTHLHPKI